MAIIPGTGRLAALAVTPSAPPIGFLIFYFKSDGVLYIQDSSGIETPLGSSSAITQLTGEVTAIGPGPAVATVSNAAVIGKVLTGFSPGPNSPVLATDTVLDAFEKLQAQVSGSVGSAVTSLTGDVTGTGPGATTTTVVTVGGKTASAIAQSVTDTQAATSTNTASTIVKRDASGNFSSNIITASLNGNATTATTSTNFSGPLNGDVTGTQSATVVSFVGGESASDVAQSVIDTQASTSSNTASTIVKRDASGNFAANVITASLTGNVTGNVSGSSSTFTGPLSGDVTGNQSTTAISSPTVTGKLLTGYVVGANTPIAATDSILLAFEKTQGQLNATTGAAITALTGDVSATGPGSVSATVNSVGGSSAANIHTAELAANAATSVNTPSTIVKRDGSGNFSATTITANLTGNVSGTASNITGIVAIANGGTNSSTALNNNRIIQSSSGSIVEAAAITANRALISDSNGIPTQSVTTATELSYVNGVTSPIQTQINAISGSAITALTGDVVATGPGSVSATIQPNSVSNSKLSDMPTLTIKGNNTGGTTDPIDLTVSQVVSMTSSVVVTQLPDQSNSAGTAPFLARADHIHNIPSGVPVQIGTANTQGSAASFSLSDHIHSHGNQTVGTLHAAVTTSVNGFMSATDKVKLDAITGTNTGDVTLAAVGSSPNANAASLSGQVLNLQPADASFPGVVTTGTQTIAGNKTFSGQTAISNTSTTALTVNSTSMVVDATNNAIGIGTAPVAASFIDGVNSTGATKRLILTGYGTGSTVGFRNRFARGTSASPTAAQSGDILGFISGQGYGASQFPAASTGAANFVAGENFTNTSNLTYLSVQTTPTGSVTLAESMRVASTGTTLGPQTSSTAIHKVSGGLYQTVRTITGNLTIDTTTTDYYILCNQSGAINITLPTPVIGRVLVIKDISGAAATNNITLVRSGTEKIEGIAASRLLQTNWGSWTLTTDGTDWFICS